MNEKLGKPGRILAVVAALVAASAPAAAVDFEDSIFTWPTGNALILSGGFAFTTNWYQGVVDASAPYGADSGSMFLAYYAGDGGFVSLARQDQAVFSLSSIDLGGWANLAGPETVTITGHRQGGGSVGLQAAIVPTSFQTFALTGFDDLTAVTLGSTIGYGYVGVDNIAMVSPIPEPTASALLLAGLGLVGFVARRRRFPDVARRA